MNGFSIPYILLFSKTMKEHCHIRRYECKFEFNKHGKCTKVLHILKSSRNDILQYQTNTIKIII